MSQCKAMWRPYVHEEVIHYCVRDEGHKGSHVDNTDTHFNDRDGMPPLPCKREGNG